MEGGELRRFSDAQTLNPKVIQRVLSRQRGTRWLSIKAWPSPGHAHALSKRTTPAEEPYTTTVRVFYLLGETK